MQDEVYRAIMSAQFQTNAAKLTGRWFTVQMDNEPQHTMKIIQELLKAEKCNVLQWPSQSPDLNQTGLLFIYIDKTKGRKNHIQVVIEGGCSNGLAKHLKGINSASGDVHRFQTSGSLELQRIFIQVLKIILIFLIMSVYAITFEPLKMKMAIIPKCLMHYFC